MFSSNGPYGPCGGTLDPKFLNTPGMATIVVTKSQDWTTQSVEAFCMISLNGPYGPCGTLDPKFLNTPGRVTIIVTKSKDLDHKICRSILHDFIKWAIWPMWDMRPEIAEHSEGSPTILTLEHSLNTLPCNV